MQNNEWSLISFTLLTQFSVGLVFMISILYLWNQQLFASFENGVSLRSPVFIVLIAVLLATLISFLHLGKPLNAPGSINNLLGSWISREILILGVFGFGVLIAFLSKWVFNLNWLFTVSLLFSLLFGLVLIFSMAKIYMLETVPAWNTIYTPVSFYASVLILGLGAILLFVIFKYPISFDYQIVKSISFFLLALIILIIFEAAFSGLHHLKLSELKDTGIESPDFSSGYFLILFVIRIFLSFLACIGFLYVLLKYGNPDFSSDTLQLLFILSFVFLVAEQIIGRLLFYASYFRVGV